MATCPSGHPSASDDFCDVCGVLIGAPPSLSLDEAAGVGSQAGGSPSGSVLPGGSVTAGAGTVPGETETCPNCGAIRVGPFCESCGYSFAAGPSGAVGSLAAATVWPGASEAWPAAPQAQGAATSAGQVQPAPTQPVPAQPVPAQPAPTRPHPVEAASQPPPAVAVAAPVGVWAAVVSADRAYYESVLAASGPDAAGIVFPAYFPQRRFRLAGPEVRIGRHSASSGINPEIDLSVPPTDPGVSRLHAVLLLAQDGTWSVVDPGSANGTVVNGSEIPQGEAVPLRDGDRINLGAWTELRLIREA